MAPRTRRKSAIDTPSVMATPISTPSLAGNTPAGSSPPTSDVPDSEADDDNKLLLPEPPILSTRPKRGAGASKARTNKRAAPDSEDLDDSASDAAPQPVMKKRRTSSVAFVELPKRSSLGRNASKTRVLSTSPVKRGGGKAAMFSSESDVELISAPPKTKTKGKTRQAPASDYESENNSTTKTKSKGRAKALVEEPETDLDEEKPAVVKSRRRVTSRSKAAQTTKKSAKGSVSVPASDAELEVDPEALEYNSAAELAIESDDGDDSGSEFGADEDDFEDDGDIDMYESDKPGPSFKKRSPAKRRARSPSFSETDGDDEDEELDTPAKRAALALDRRLSEIAAGGKGYDINSDEEVALSKATKGKGKGKQKKGKGDKDGHGPSKEELRGLNREEKRLLRLKHSNPLKYEETIMRKELGRKLTYAEKSSCALRVHHPELKNAWGDLEADVPIVEPVRAEQPSGLSCTLLPFQQESLTWMRKQELGVYGGGLLADEMGMGKTIQMIALMVSEPGRPNLVIAPTVAVMQWRNEIQTHTVGMKVVVWHGAGRENDIDELVKNDVVLTTYAVVESCFRKQEAGWKRKGVIVKSKSPVHSIEWNRVILDEAHNIKERATNTAKAAFALKASYRWCLSGTPLQNRVGELYSLVRFLGVDPFSFYYCKRCDCKSLHWRFKNKKGCDDCGHSPMQHTCYWNNEILTPIQKHAVTGPGKLAFKKLHILLDRIMLRRTKLQKAEDLGLPPRTIIVRRDYFSPEEKELYLSLFTNAKREFSTYVGAGTLLNNYSNVFSLLTRMRQMACHPDLVLRSRNNKLIEGLDEEAAVCRLCHDSAEDAIAAKCKHIFDRECIRQYLSTADEAQPDCPVCHVPLTIDLEADAIDFGAAPGRQGILGRLELDTWRSSTKIEALVEELDSLRRRDATTKSIVFSQFVNFLDLIAFRLQRAGFVVCRLEGTMSPQARDATIKHFMNNVHVTVFLVSLKAGGVALNLTEASRVYLMDSWWNPAVEFQAMDRIHRLGQHRPVRAIKLVVEDSIESRIVQLQEKKSAMVDATLSTDDQAMGRLTADDLSFLFRL